MLFKSVFLHLLPAALAARPFLNAPDTGLELELGSTPEGTLPELDRIVGLPDFEWAARRVLNDSLFQYFRTGAAGEYSYRNNFEAFYRFSLKPRVMIDVSKVNTTLGRSILGHQFTAPFFIAPNSYAGEVHPDGEAGIVKAAYNEGILYVPSRTTRLPIDELAASKPDSSQVLFQQVYLDDNDTETKRVFRELEDAGMKAIVFTADAPVNGNRHRQHRFPIGPPDPDVYNAFTWDFYERIKTFTNLPIVIKGVQTIEDVRLAIQHGAPGVYISNHGGRQLDGSRSPLEVAIEIHKEEPELFQQIDIFADGGVRYGIDVLKLLALGVKAVGVGRPFTYSNTFGEAGVRHALQLLKREVSLDAANLGVPDVGKINSSYVSFPSVLNVSRILHANNRILDPLDKQQLVQLVVLLQSSVKALIAATN